MHGSRAEGREGVGRAANHMAKQKGHVGKQKWCMDAGQNRKGFEKRLNGARNIAIYIRE